MSRAERSAQFGLGRPVADFVASTAVSAAVGRAAVGSFPPLMSWWLSPDQFLARRQYSTAAARNLYRHVSI